MTYRSFLFFLLASFHLYLYSQPYQIGSRQMTFTDPSRVRNIATYVYHPSLQAGTNQQFASGSFPLIIFGHGFSMNYNAYLNFVDSLVPLGYIIVFPTTEVGPIPFPNHEDFGFDLKFLNSYIKAQNNEASSFFYQHVTSTSAIMGHSMGGGCSFLASQNNSEITTMVTFAPAETNTSAITAATGITVPALVFSGENDGVTLPVENHIPMYNNLSSSCKTFVNIIGGGHCYYALSNFACDFGESTSSPQPTITRTQQQQAVFKLLIPYLDFYLNSNSLSEIIFLNRLQSMTEITYERDCLSSIQNTETNKIGLYPIPCDKYIQIPHEFSMPCNITIFDISGKKISDEGINNRTIDISSLNSGYYLLLINCNSKFHSFKIIKN